MRNFRIDFAFDDQSGIYRCMARNSAEAISHFDLMVEQLSIPVDILRVEEEKWMNPELICEAQAT